MPKIKLSPRKHDEFLESITTVFKYAKFLGIPTFGGSIAHAWAIVLLVMLIFIEVGAIWKLIRLLTGMATNTTPGYGLLARLSGSIFYGNALLSHILSWKLISTWTKLSKYWSRNEFNTRLYFPPDPKIRKRVIFVATFVGTFAFVEHTLSMMSATGFDIRPAEYFDKYILTSHGFLLQAHEYSLWIAIPVFILSKIATFLWNFQDLIIILVSMGLASRYNRLNMYVQKLVAFEKKSDGVIKECSDAYIQRRAWRSLREAYVKQATLVHMVDAALGALVLLSNANNFYFICLQLFLGIHSKSKGKLISKLYYFMSLGWLVLRACCVVLAASDVNVHSRRALAYLSSCPNSSYNIEIKRLFNQLSNQHVVLSGMGLFSLNRQMLLEVIAGIVKYELILLQFDV